MLKLTIILFLLVGPFFGKPNMLAQIPSSRFGNKPTLTKTIESLGDQYNGGAMLFGYEHSYFLNSIFEENIQNRYQRAYNYCLGVRVTKFPFSLEGIYFNDQYKVKNLPGIEENKSIHHRGFEFTALIVPPPYTTISRTILPHLGIGYQFSQLCYHCIQTEDDPDDLNTPISSIGTSGLFGKAGIGITIDRYTLQGEYKQSILINSEQANSSWRISLLIKPTIDINRNTN